MLLAQFYKYILKDKITPKNRHLQASLFALLLLFSVSTFSQTKKSLNKYHFAGFLMLEKAYDSLFPFVRYEKNNFAFYTPVAPNHKGFYDKFERVIKQKQGKLNLYHLGGSHLQADIYTHDIRTFLQTHWQGLAGERAWVFPFNLAHSNNPGNYRFESDNTWKGYRSAKQKQAHIPYDYGLLGYVMTTKDSVANLHFYYRKTEVKPPIQHIKILHNRGAFPYEINFGDKEQFVIKSVHNPRVGSTDVYFSIPIYEFDLQFVKTTDLDEELEIYGFLLTNDEPGFSYSAIGVNGAGLYTYLDNRRFKEQLEMYPPDMFVFSVGTNDGNVPYNKFHPETYKSNLIKMIDLVLSVNPDCAIFLTVPNDSFYKRRYLNRNIARERKIIVEVAKKYQLPVWDLYGLMGELGSSKIWLKNQLMRPDLIHFTFEGYHFKGKLFIDAFMKYLKEMEDIYE